MTIINWYTSLFLKGKLWDISENQKKYLERISASVTRLIDIVNDMLNIWKLEAKKMDFKYESFDINELVKEVSSEFKEICLTKDISIQAKWKSLTVNCDKDKIRQVLNNLIWNSYKFTNNWGKINIKLEKNWDMFKISVIDNWIWIKKEDIDKLFKKFSQIDSHLQRKWEWTGLWLVICKLIVEQMNGKMWAESEEGKWSVFSFSLPIVIKRNL